MPSPTSQTISTTSSGLIAARAQPPRAVDVGMDHGAARVGLEGERLRQPALAEAVEQRGVVALASCGRSRGRGRARPRTRCADRRSRRAPAARRAGPTAPPSRMHALGPGALGQVFDDAARHAAGDAERVDELARVESQRGADAGRGRRSRRTPRSDGSPPCAPPWAPPGSAGTSISTPTAMPSSAGARRGAAARQRRAPPARSRRRRAPARPRRCRRNPRRARPCR